VRVILKCKNAKEKFSSPQTLGEHIRQKRISLGLYQRQVAELIGVGEFTVHNWEKKKTTPAITCYPGVIRFLGYDPGVPTECPIPEILKAKKRWLG